MAQARALEQLYGDPNQVNQEQETPNDPDSRDEQNQQDERREDQDQDREQDDRQDREDRQDDEQSRDEAQDEQGRQNEHNQRKDPTPAPVPAEAGEKANSLDDKVKRGKHARQEAPALAERMPGTPSHPQQAPKAHAQTKDAPQFEPLESLIAKARERAAAKNAARTHAIDRTKDRVRAREVDFGH